MDYVDAQAVQVPHSGRFEAGDDHVRKLLVFAMVSVWEAYSFPDPPIEHVGKTVTPSSVGTAAVLLDSEGGIRLKDVMERKVMLQVPICERVICPMKGSSRTA